tara:strand:- start:3819 stop:4469 length:651 start_codon:yes stop_codon:yes gene_type:complete
MSKKKQQKKKKTTLPNNVKEEEFLSVLDNISKRLGNKFKFGYHTFEDMKQQAAIFALEGLKRYDASRPLENFLWTHVRNRLFNYKRDHYQRPDIPCNTCPFFDKHCVKSQNQCTEFTNRNDCELYNGWYIRNNAKKNIMKPVDIENTSSPSKALDVEDIVDNNEILNIIDIKMPTQYRDIYLKFRHGDKISKNDQKKIISIIKATLKEHYEDEQNS